MGRETRPCNADLAELMQEHQTDRSTKLASVLRHHHKRGGKDINNAREVHSEKRAKAARDWGHIRKGDKRSSVIARGG